MNASSMERMLIGSLIVERDAIADVVELVQPDDFAEPECRRAYSAILSLWERREPPDLALVDTELRTRHGEDGPSLVTLLAYQQEVFEFGHGIHARYYAQKVQLEAQRNRFSTLYAATVVRLNQDPDLSPVDAIAEISSAVIEGAGSGLSGPRKLADLVPLTVQRVIDERTGVAVRRVTPSGIASLDDLLGGGMRPQELIVLAARSSMGKTAYASHLIAEAAKVGNVILFSAEMSADSVIRRDISREGNVPMQAVQRADMTDPEFDRFMRASEQVQAWNVWIDDTIAVTTDQIMARTQRLRKEGPISLVVIDYLELIGDPQPKGSGGSGGDQARVSAIVKRLKQIARLCDVPLVVLSQVSRDVDRRANKMPTLADLRWSALIEQTADQVLFLYRHDYYVGRSMEDYDPDRAGITELLLAKNRNGPEGLVQMRYDPQTFTFRDLEAGTAARDPWQTQGTRTDTKSVW